MKEKKKGSNGDGREGEQYGGEQRKEEDEKVRGKEEKMGGKEQGRKGDMKRMETNPLNNSQNVIRYAALMIQFYLYFNVDFLYFMF